MNLWFWINLSLAAECPKHDLYVHKLDAYTIEIGDERVQFRLVVDEEKVVEPEVELWITVLRSCRAENTLAKFVEWQDSWQYLTGLGLDYQSARCRQRWRLRGEIRNIEREMVIQYAQMLYHFELETGISVLWNVEEYPLAKGMVSAGRGSLKVYQYIFSQYNFVQYE